jgi:hypothetical protein
LRIVYRLIVLFVAEDRDLLFHPAASETARTRYTLYYSMSRLRHLAERRMGTRHFDLFSGLRLVMEKLGSDGGYPELGLPALNSFLFSREAIADLADGEIANRDLLDAIRALAFTSDGQTRRIVDYRNLGPEELGSVYESLLELHPALHIDTATFKLDTASGHERKTTGSYYTPTSLITCLLDSALDPVLDEASRKADPETAILKLKVCDPACGSGHFLIAAAHRIARRLAAVRTGEEEPPPHARRKALRDVIGRCIYGVDINPMSVELCKVNLWMEAIEPGKPLSFLERHIQCGNSLLGATPALLAQGIPDSAFEPIEADDKKVCSEYKKRNRQQREGNHSLFDPTGNPWEHLSNLATDTRHLEEIGDDTVEEIHRKQEYYNRLVQSRDYLDGCLLADAWSAAFVWKKNSEFVYPITEEVFRTIEENPESVPSWMRAEVLRLREQYQFFHWHLAFPDVFRVPTGGELPTNEQAGWSGGFDVVLGNPPWERIKIQEKEWFAEKRPDITNAANSAQRRRMIAALAYEDLVLYTAFMEDQRQAEGESHLVRDSGRYPLCGRGDVNTYSIFAEAMRLIIGSTGRVGCIVPSGIATDDTLKFFFGDLMSSGALVSLFAFENEAKLFAGIDHRVRFALLTIAGDSVHISNADFAFGLYRADDLNEEERHFTLSATDVALLNPNTHTCPIFRSKRDKELVQAIYKRIPILIREDSREGKHWDISFSRMFDMANDSHLFRTRKQLEADGWQLERNAFHKGNEIYLPLYEGKMVWHFDHRFGTYEGQTQAQANQNKLPEFSEKQHDNPYLLSMPQYWVHESHLPDIMRDGRQALVAFRDITNAGVLRTSVFSILPVVPCGHTLPVVVVNAKYTSEVAYLASCTSSFVFDYVARQKLGGTHMTFFILKQLPVLPPERFASVCNWDARIPIGDWIWPRAFELTYTAWDMEPFAKDCGYDGSPFRWNEERRFLLRCELDAAFFHLYGIERDDVDHIMTTFRVAKDEDEKLYREYRTKRVILEIYDRMKQSMDTGEPYQTALQPLPADPSLAHSSRIGMNV